MKESQCLLHLQRLFWTPFCLYFSARRPREILAAVRARASRDDTICSKNRNFDPYHRDKARSRAYGLLPLWLLVMYMTLSVVLEKAYNEIVVFVSDNYGALQNLQAFSNNEVTNVNVCTKHEPNFILREFTSFMNEFEVVSLFRSSRNYL